MAEKIKILDKEFEKSINSTVIQEAIQKIAQALNTDFHSFKNEVVFIGILNGAFMFAADLFKQITFPCKITFLKLASYQGSSSSGVVKSLIGINENLKNKTVIVIEDIVDTGETLENIICQLKGFEPAEIRIATFLFKPNAYKKQIPIHYIGIEVPNDFIIGYGLDYDGYGRNLPEIYTLVR
ncbi:MAG: hypoxanthine phosphoribosyltransferase [Bacteroidales bacterium]|nr:hypoxanthine phosphoribosyltransferase [Bacteroidales bacterium]